MSNWATLLDIKLIKLNPEAITPVKGSASAAGYDLFSLESYDLRPHERHLFKTGISLEIPVGYYGRIAPRSGLALKQGLDTLAGVIDSDYRGDIGIILLNTNNGENEIIHIDKGQKIAQIIFEQYFDALLCIGGGLNYTVRGENGYGSSDKPINHGPIV